MSKLDTGNVSVVAAATEEANLFTGNVAIIATATEEANLFAGLVMLVVDDVSQLFGGALLQGDFLVMSGIEGVATSQQQGAVGRLQGGIMPGGPLG